MTDDDYMPTMAGGPPPAPSQSALSLRHRSGSRSGQTDRFTASQVDLGRRPNVDLRFDSGIDILVSGQHARLVRDEQQIWHLEDLGSTNGTGLNGHAVQGRQRIYTGDVIVLGSATPCEGAAEFEVEIEGDSSRRQETPAGPGGLRPVDPFGTVGDRGMPVPPPAPPGPGYDPGRDASPKKGEGDRGGIFGRIGRGVKDAMERRELRGKVDKDREQLGGVRSRAEEACMQLGRQTWHDLAEARNHWSSAAGLQPFGAGLEQIEARIAAVDTEVAAARQASDERLAAWEQQHEQLKAAADESEAEARRRLSAAEEAAVDASASVADRIADLSAVRDSAQTFLDAQAREPDEGFAERLQALAPLLRAALASAEAPLDDLPRLLAARAEARRQADAGRTAAHEAIAAVDQSERERDAEKSSLAAQESEFEQRKQQMRAEIADLERQYAAAFVAYGREIVSVGGGAAGQLSTFSQARMAQGEYEALQARIAEHEQRLADLDS